MKPLLVAALPWALLTSSCAPPEVCGPLGAPPPTPVSPTVVLAHAHNDYEHERPLLDALGRGFPSVEVDVWHRDGDVVVSHDPWTRRGTLAGLYLDPLQERLADRGSVHGDGAPFTLWLDLKDGTAALRALIAADLGGRDFLRRFEDGEGLFDAPTADGPVRVIVTGDAAAKQALLDEVPAPRPFVVDSNDVPAPPAGPDATDGASDDGSDLDPRVAAFALSFPVWLGSWDGQGEVPAAIRDRGACLIARARSEGPFRRAVRFFGGPDTPAAWDLSLDLGADFLHTDDLDGVARHLDGG